MNKQLVEFNWIRRLLCGQYQQRQKCVLDLK